MAVSLFFGLYIDSAPSTYFVSLGLASCTTNGATRTTSKKPERPYNAKYANIKEQSGNERPLLLSGCIQLILVTTSTSKTPRPLQRKTLSERDPAFGPQAVNRCVSLPEQ